jgi:uncharacterized repeat protein (TIGR01451 family)
MATSAGYTATAAGTDYWVATYNGDSNNSPVSSGTALEPVVITGGTPDIAITKTADQGTVTAGTTIGFTITITNTGGANATGVTLQDNLPPGSGGDVFWTIDTSNTGLGAGTNPASFLISGTKGSQVLTLNGQPITLAAGASLKVHITSPTNAGDVSGGLVGVSSGVSSSVYLGAAGDYAVLYEGIGGHNLSITNVSIGGNVGVGGTGKVQFSGPGTVTGRLDLAAANTGQFSNNNGSNVGPASVNYGAAVVTTALNTVNSLSSSLAGLGATASIAISGTQTINESAGELDTVNGVTYRIFSIKSYSSGDGKLLTINGDGSGDPVVFNFGFNNNVNLGGDVALTGSGLSDDKVIWNFTSSNQNISLNNNASSFPGIAFHGIILAPNDGISLVNANLSGRVFGGDSKDMQIVSGDTIHAPVLNTATVTASNVTFDPDDTASASITITGTSFKPKGAPQLATSSASLAGAGIGEILGWSTLQADTIRVAADVPPGPLAAGEQAAIAAAIGTLDAEVRPLGINLMEVPSDQAAQIHIQLAAGSAIGSLDQGILAAFTPGGNITLISNWIWYLGSDSAGIAPNQYDFQTVVMHELGHVLGLGENADPSSAMSLYLSPGQVRRELSTTDLSLLAQVVQVPQPLPAGGDTAPGVRAISTEAVDGLPNGINPDTSSGNFVSPVVQSIPGSLPTPAGAAASPLALAGPSDTPLDHGPVAPQAAGNGLAQPHAPAVPAQGLIVPTAGVPGPVFQAVPVSPAPGPNLTALPSAGPNQAGQSPWRWLEAPQGTGHLSLDLFSSSLARGQAPEEDRPLDPSPPGQQPQRPAPAPPQWGSPRAVPDNGDAAADLDVAAHLRLEGIDACFAQEDWLSASPADGLSPPAPAEQPRVIRSVMAFAAALGFLGLPWQAPEEEPDKRRQRWCSPA